MAKEIKTVLKLNLPAGSATPAPPVGTALGPHGINIMDFVNKYNQATKDKKGQIIPVELTIFADRTFTFITKLPPTSELIKQKLKIKKGSASAPKEIAGTMTKIQLQEIAEAKLADLNTTNVNQAIKIIAGTARSMGIKIK